MNNITCNWLGKSNWAGLFKCSIDSYKFVIQKTHFNQRSIIEMNEKDLVEDLPKISHEYEIFETCQQRKQTKLPFQHTKYVALWKQNHWMILNISLLYPTHRNKMACQKGKTKWKIANLSTCQSKAKYIATVYAINQAIW